MRPFEQCKAAGLDSLAELARLSGQQKQKLIRWHKQQPFLFESVLMLAVFKKNGGNDDEQVGKD